jgi:hypothetical protein
MQVTKTKLKEYYAAKLRRDVVAQQLIMREIIIPTNQHRGCAR